MPTYAWLVRFSGLHELAELGHELVDVAKRPVDAGKAHVRHLVGFAQARHRLFADHRRADLFFAAILQVALDGVGDRLDLLDADRPLVARRAQAAR